MSSCWTMSPRERCRMSKPECRKEDQACDHFIRHSAFDIRHFQNCGSWNRTNVSTFRASHLAIRRSRIVRCVFGHASLVKVRELRGQESNLRTRGSKPRIFTSRNYPTVGEGRVGLEPTRWCLTDTGSAAELPTQLRVPCGSALRESNPPVQGGGLVPLPIGQGHVLLLKAEAVGLEPTTGHRPAPAFEAGSSSSRMTSIGLGCGGRSRTCIRLGNSEPPYRWATPQCAAVSVVGFEPTLSCARGTRIPRLSHTLKFAQRGSTFLANHTIHANEKAPSGS